MPAKASIKLVEVCGGFGGASGQITVQRTVGAAPGILSGKFEPNPAMQLLEVFTAESGYDITVARLRTTDPATLFRPLLRTVAHAVAAQTELCPGIEATAADGSGTLTVTLGQAKPPRTGATSLFEVIFAGETALPPTFVRAQNLASDIAECFSGPMTRNIWIRILAVHSADEFRSLTVKAIGKAIRQMM